MPKLLSRSKHEEFKSNSALQMNDQKEGRVKSEETMEHCEIWFLQHCSQPLHPASTVPAAPCSPAFHALLFLLQFLVFLLSTLVVITYVWIVWYFTWFVRLHKPFCIHCWERRFFAVNKFRVQVLPFFPFLSFSLPFSAAKHSSEDDNSEDGWLDLFLLEEEGCWLGFGGNTRSSVFNACIYGCLSSYFSLRLKSLKHALFNVYLASFLGSMDTFTRSIEAQLVVSC